MVLIVLLAVAESDLHLVNYQSTMSKIEDGVYQHIPFSEVGKFKSFPQLIAIEEVS